MKPSSPRRPTRPRRATIRVLSIGHSYAIALNRATMRELARLPGFEVTLLAPRGLDGDLRPIVLEPEPPRSLLEVIGLDATFTSYLDLLEYDRRQLDRAVRSRPFDILHAWVEPWTLSARQILGASRRRSARFCFWTFQNIAREYPKPFCDIERAMLKRADCWLAAGSLVRDVQIDRGYPAGTAHPFYPGVDTTVFRPNTPAETTAILEELGLTPPVMGFLGRLTEAKGLDVMTAALDRLDRALDWSLLLMGSGPDEARIAAWVAERGLERRVRTRLLRHDEVPRYLGAVDLLLSPSQTRARWREQFARAAIEAFAAGVPVIVSDSGGHPFAAGDAARVLPESDVDAWARAIEDLLVNEAERLAMSRRGLARARTFSATTLAQELAAIFTRLAGRPA